MCLHRTHLPPLLSSWYSGAASEGCRGGTCAHCEHVDALGTKPRRFLAFGEQKQEETVDERKRRWWEKGKGNFKHVERSQKKGDRSRWEELKGNLLRKEGRKWIPGGVGGVGRGGRIGVRHCMRVKKRDCGWNLRKGWKGLTAVYRTKAGSLQSQRMDEEVVMVHVWSGFQLETLLNVTSDFSGLLLRAKAEYLYRLLDAEIRANYYY